MEEGRGAFPAPGRCWRVRVGLPSPMPTMEQQEGLGPGRTRGSVPASGVYLLDDLGLWSRRPVCLICSFPTQQGPAGFLQLCCLGY